MSVGTYLCTVNPDERDVAMGTGLWQDEGIICWVPTYGSPRDLVPVERLNRLGDYLYTRDHGEFQRDGFVSEGPQFSTATLISDDFLITADPAEIKAIQNQGWENRVPWFILSRPSGPHFYTVDDHERDNAVATANFIVEEEGFSVHSNEAPETVPLFRLYNQAEHFYTVDPAERDAGIAAGAILEGISCWVYQQPAPDRTPVFRLFDPPFGYSFTTSLTERDSAVRDGIVNEGIAFYAPDGPLAGTVPLHRLQKLVTLPLYRLYHHSGIHYFTVSQQERDDQIRQGYTVEGLIGYVLSRPWAGTVSVVPYDGGSQNIVWALSTENLPSWYRHNRDPHQSFYVFYADRAGLVKVQTFVRTPIGSWRELYMILQHGPDSLLQSVTADYAEFMAHAHDVYSFLGYVFPTAVPNTTPLYRLKQIARTVVIEQDFEISKSAGIVDTGIYLRPGDEVSFEASGTIHDGGLFTGRNGPEGWDRVDHNPDFPLHTGQDAHPFALLGGYQEGSAPVDWFFIGAGRRGPDHEGLYVPTLVLRINDYSPRDGDGAFTCTVRISR